MTVLLPSLARRSRFLFELDAAACLSATDQSLDAVTGQAATFARASLKYVPDTDGRYQPVGHSLGAFEWATDPVSGLSLPGLVLEDASTNLVVQSDALATGWTLTGTVATTNAYATYAGRPFSRVSSASGGNVLRTVTFTGNGAKAFSFLVRQDAAVSGNASFLVVDATATVTRGRIAVTIAANGTITAVGSSGATILRTQALADGVYRIFAQVAGIVAANTNQVYVGEGATATAASYLVSGVQAENRLSPSSLMPTTSATVTRAADALRYACNLLPRVMTVYAKFVEAGTTASAGSFGGVLLLGDPSSVTGNQFYVGEDGAGHYRTVDRTVSASAAAAPTMGQLTELRAVLNTDGSTLLGQAIAGGAEVVTAATAALTLPSAWSGATLVVGALTSAPGNCAFLVLHSLRIAAGVQTLAFMQQG